MPTAVEKPGMGEESQGPSPHMQPGEEQGMIIEGGQPGGEQGFIVEDGLPQPGEAEGFKEVDPAPAKKRKTNYLIGLLLGLLGLFLLLFGFMTFGPPVAILNAAHPFMSDPEWMMLACPSDPSFVAPDSGDVNGDDVAVGDVNGDGNVNGDDAGPAQQGGSPFFFAYNNAFMFFNGIRGNLGIMPLMMSPEQCGSLLGETPGGEDGGAGTGYCDSPCTTDADCAANYVCLPVGQCWVQACDAPTTTCGDGACSTDESAATCPQDCGQCGNGVCDPGEHVYNCSADCGEPPAPQEPTNPAVCTCACDRFDAAGKCEAGHDTCSGASCLP